MLLFLLFLALALGSLTLPVAPSPASSSPRAESHDRILDAARKSAQDAKRLAGRWCGDGVESNAAGRLEPRHLRVLVHRLQIHNPGLEHAHAIERLGDRLVDHEARECSRREEVLAPEADRDALPHRAWICGDHGTVEERERRELGRFVPRAADLPAFDLAAQSRRPAALCSCLRHRARSWSAGSRGAARRRARS